MPKTTLTEYIAAALTLARYEYCDETEQWCVYIDRLPGAWAQGKTVEEARAELAEVVEGWLIVALQRSEPIPTLNGLRIGKAGKRVQHATAQAS